MSSVPCSRSIGFATDSPCVSRRENNSTLLGCQGELIAHTPAPFCRQCVKETYSLVVLCGVEYLLQIFVKRSPQSSRSAGSIPCNGAPPRSAPVETHGRCAA